MDEGTLIHLDVEFKRYLQILRPYLGQLIDQNIIDICNAWIQRLSNSKDEEKALRNKYVFALCYQLAKGILDKPFLKEPPENQLELLYDSINSDDSSSEVEYLVVNFEEPNTKVLYEGKKHMASETEYLSQDYTDVNDKISDCQSKVTTEIDRNNISRKQTVLCYTCPEILRNYTPLEINDTDYEYRANNLIKKLREIKTQNKMLHNELLALKEESKMKYDDSMDEITKIDTATSTCIHSSASSITLKSLKEKVQELNDSRNDLIDTISNLQDKLDNFTEMKKHEMEDIEAKHRLEVIKLRASIREELKATFEIKLEEQKVKYENTITEIHNNTENEIKHLSAAKDEIIVEKEKLINLKDSEICHLQTQLEEQKNHLNSVFSKFLDKPTENMSGENVKLKTYQLEKRLSKLEKSKMKCARAYEAKLAHLQREKHLAECSIQLQLVRQRAQVVNEVTEDNHSELTAALDRLENKYKDIVAKMQATAIQRRMQDQMALDNIIQATCGIENSYNFTQATNSQFNKVRPQNQGYDSEVSIMRGNKVGNVIVGNKSFGEESVIAGYCLNGERMGELFERVYIPQRDGENQK